MAILNSDPDLLIDKYLVINLGTLGNYVPGGLITCYSESLIDIFK